MFKKNSVEQLMQSIEGNKNQSDTSKKINNTPVSAVNVGQLKQTLFSSVNTTPNQKPTSVALKTDLEIFQNNKENFIHNKKAISKQFSESQKKLSEYLTMKADTIEKQFYGEQKNLFKEKRLIIMKNLEEKLSHDLSQLQSKKIFLPKEMTVNSFLELAFCYRSYEVCLEEDFYLKLIARIRRREKIIQNTSLTASSSLFSNERSEELKLLEGAPVIEAVQSLNYYEDFFKNLPYIEQIWPNAGAYIRWCELRVMYVNHVYGKMDVLLNLLDYKIQPKYKNSSDKFLDDFEKYLNHKDEIDKKNYIDLGDGLDIKNHPWTKEDLKRLPQANKTLDFNSILSENARENVENRIESDKKDFSF